MAANEYQISAGITPIDNSTGATEQSYYISAGVPPDDTVVVEAGPPAGSLSLMGVGR